jgi:nucleoside-diphosphate-sugar epimerase
MRARSGSNREDARTDVINVLILGASGQIATWVVKALADRPETAEAQIAAG